MGRIKILVYVAPEKNGLQLNFNLINLVLEILVQENFGPENFGPENFGSGKFWSWKILVLEKDLVRFLVPTDLVLSPERGNFGPGKIWSWGKIWSDSWCQ